ncbi:MAG: translation initiation factor IF-2 [Puniceicoccales bacterium]|jgi:translation initiation factor IF-2|nr:translation initiation factor IF-2 [Puniceicoccales bacterium]
MSVRVYQLAKQLGLESKHVIQLLRERGLDVSSPSNTIPSIYADALIEEIGDKKLVFRENKEKKLPKTPPKSAAPADVGGGDVVGAVGKEIPISNTSPDAIPDSNVLVESKANAVAKIHPTVETNVVKAQPPIQQERKRHPLVVSVGSLDKGKRKGDEPEVRLPELPKSIPVPVEENKPAPVEKQQSSGFKPFLKKIERQQKATNLQSIEVKLPVIVRALATQMNIKPFQLISKLMSMNTFASMNQEIDISIAKSVAEKFGYALEVAKPEPEKIAKPKSTPKGVVRSPEKKGQNLVERPPVVCVFGHIDHGKTTLLDTIRHAKVAAGEAGGITQHVAAYQVDQSGKKITFIDTPGHAAFSKMRERGANMTDIGILVVAADDGFMPQTDEALKFARKANIPVVVAINKIDAKGANVDRVKQQMQQHGITPEDWGGDTLCATISALKGTNIENLLELIRLQAEIMELRTDLSTPPEGVILESRMAVGHGATASAIVQDGTLKIGDCVICGSCYCKIKTLINDRGQQIKEASASTPISIIGWSDVPEIGAKFSFVESEKLARKRAEENAIAAEKDRASHDDDVAKISSVDQLFSAIAAVEEKTLNVILRADVHGSAEVLQDFLETIKSKKIKLNVLSCDVGSINKNDVMSADTSNAQIVAFNVKVESNAQSLAKQLGVKIIQHNIIYEIVDQVREAMSDCLDPELRENKLGAAEVRQIFSVKNDVVAGCMVTEGRICRDKFARVVRKKEVIFQGKFASIRRQKEDVNEVRAGFECGIVIATFDPFIAGDVIECFEIKKIQPSL